MEEHIGNNKNPFLNHLVIENILKYTNSVAELINLRLLCRQWDALVGPKLMKSSIVNITSERKMRKFQEAYQDFLPVHKNFHLKVLQSLEADTTKSFIRFILETGKARELHLSKCVMRPHEILNILKLGRNLQILSFNEVLIDPEEWELEMISEDFSSELMRLEVTCDDEEETFPWAKILSCLPKLQALHAQLQSSEQVTRLLESLLELEIRAPLQEFSSFLCDFDAQQLNLLRSLELPLRDLDISVSSTVTKESVQEFLKSSSLASIENLKLYHETEGNFEISVPKLNNLKSLELMGDATSSKIFASISKFCLNLKHLNLSQVIFSEEILEMNFVHKALLSLSIEEGYLSRSELMKLGTFFPNISQVYLFLNDENISALYKTFENLEEIIVLGTELTDLGIIGVSLNCTSKISDCKKLKRFSLYPQPQHKITDLSIYHGLVDVTQLVFVELPETAVTNDGLRALIKAKPNLTHLSAKLAINPRTGEHSLRSTKYQIL